MRNIYIALILSGCLVVAPASANASKEENIGVGAGAVIGAAAGGPVGFLLGAAAGAIIGEQFDKRNTEVGALTSSLQSSTTKVTQLEQDIDSLNHDINEMGSELTRVQ